MAVMYMSVCIFDFILFPIMFTVVQFWEILPQNDAFRQWNPITLLGGGLFHVAMGAVLGVTAWSRGQEKIAGVAAAPALPAPVSQAPVNSVFATPAPVAAWPDPAPPGGTVLTGWGGKKAPPPVTEWPER